MLNSLRNNSMWGTRLKGVLAASVLAASGAATAATVTLDLCATTGSTTLPAKGVGNTVINVSVPVLGYTLATTCVANGATAPIGPVIDVNVGDTVQVTLHNALAKNTGLLFQGQALVPDTTGIGTGGTKVYSFLASTPGTYLYEAAPLVGAEYQAAMGLHGALVVRPSRPVRNDLGVVVTLGLPDVTDTAALATDVGLTVSGTGIPSGTTITAVVPGVSFTMSAPATADGTAVTVTLPAVAYDNAATSYDNEAVLVLSEIDTALNTKLDPSTFDMRSFAAKYFLINGQPHPNTTPITTAAGKKLLLRYVNAGVKHHSMAVLGLRQNFVAKDAGTLPTFRHNVAAETLASGQTGDAIINIPASATTTSSFAVYDANLAFNNSDARGFGGMLTFINAGAGTAVAGPVSNALLLNPSTTNGSVSLALSASISSAASTVASAEYFIGTKGTDGTGTAMNGTFGSATVAAAATIPASALTGLTDGTYTVYVHGKDATSATTVWGAATTATLKLDRLAPTTTIGSSGLSPNPSNGAVTVALTATANDAAAGNSNIVAAEYSIDGTAAVAMSVSSAAPTTTVFATIPSGLAPGSHSVTVRSQDAAGNWSALAPITLTVQSAPPSTTGVSAAKSPNNGTVPLSATQPVVRVSASLASAGSTIAGAEGFICPTAGVTCAAGALGSGFPFVPTDGGWGGASEAGYADVPLATVAALSNGNHVILVRGKDASGNWGPTSSTTLVIDKTAPTISSATLSASTIVFGAASTTLTVVSSDVGTSVVGGQYWIDGTTTPPASTTAFTGGSVVINTSTLTAGAHTVRVRVQDAATNWSAVTSVTLNVMRAVNDAKSFNVNGTAQSQNFDFNAGNGVLANDQPTGLAGRTVRIASAPVRTSNNGTGGTGNGAGIIAIACQGGGGNTAATPAIGGSTLCTNGAFRVTLTAPAGANTNALRQAAKRGTYQFTYTEILNGVEATATVTITTTN